MSISTKTVITSDTILCSLEDSASTPIKIEWDIAADSNPLLGHGAHSTTKWTSQAIKAQGFTKDGVYENTTLTVTFLASEFNQIETWWKNGTKLKYTVTGIETTPKVYEDCIARASSTPTITPGKTDYVTFQIEITCLKDPSAS